MEKEVDEKYRWNFSDYFSSDAQWEKQLKVYRQKVGEMAHFAGQLQDRNTIFLCFKKLEELSVMADTLSTYAMCLRDLDVTNSHYVSMVGKVENAITYYAEQTAFIEPEISALDDAFLAKLISDDTFAPYRRLLRDILRDKPHILPKEEEKLLSGIMSFSDDFATNHSNFENGDLEFRKVRTQCDVMKDMDQNLAILYLKNRDRVLRENAFKELQGAYGRYNNFLSSNFLAHVKKDVYFTKIRHFNSSLEKALFYEDVPSQVYKKLIENVNANLSIEHDYFELKRKILGYEQFYISDVHYNPFKTKKKCSYEEAMDLVCDALGILGEDYVSYIRYMQENRMIDVFPAKNKRGGAYETMAPTKTPRVLANFMESYYDVSTLAHELGHAMHSYYSDQSQNPINAQYTIFLAEIASTVNETLLNKYLMDHARDKKDRLYYICEYLSEFHSTVFRQTMFSEFEDIIHDRAEKDKDLSSEILNNTYLDLAKKYFGDKVVVFDETKYEWSRIPHFFNSFYVYKYATGMICAINIAQGLINGTLSVEDYKTFLSAGCSMSPCDILKLVNIDLTTDKPYKVAFDYIKSLLRIFDYNVPKFIVE